MFILSPPDPDADLTFEQTAWGDSGVYYCSVVSAQDLDGNNEAYAELIVLGEWGWAQGMGSGGAGAGMPFVHSVCPPSVIQLGPVACFAPSLAALPVTWASPCPAPQTGPFLISGILNQPESK